MGDLLGEFLLLAAGGIFTGWVARLAANRWYEGMGIGLWEPIAALLRAERAQGKPGAGEIPRAPVWPAGGYAARILIFAALAGFFAIAAFFPAPERFWLLIFAALMLVASAVDQKHYFIPDPVVFLMLALGLARCFHPDPFLLLEVNTPLLQQAALGFLAAYIFSVLLQTFFDALGRDAFFWGDLKYSLALGVWIGFPAIIWMLLAASLLGLAYSAISRRRHFAFAPFLSAGAMLLLFTRERISFFLTDLLV